jgi:hypothetical protein
MVQDPPPGEAVGAGKDHIFLSKLAEFDRLDPHPVAVGRDKFLHSRFYRAPDLFHGRSDSDIRKKVSLGKEGSENTPVDCDEINRF